MWLGAEVRAPILHIFPCRQSSDDLSLRPVPDYCHRVDPSDNRRCQAEQSAHLSLLFIHLLPKYNGLS